MFADIFYENFYKKEETALKDFIDFVANYEEKKYKSVFMKFDTGQYIFIENIGIFSIIKDKISKKYFFIKKQI